MLHQGVQDRQPLAHAGRKGPFASSLRPARARSIRSAPPSRGPRPGYSSSAWPARGRVPPRSSGGPGACHDPGERGDPDHSGPALAAQGAPRRQVEPARAGTDRAQAGDAAPQLFALPPHGLARRVVSRSSSSAASRVLSPGLGAGMSVCRRGGALPRRCWAAVRLATRGRRPPGGRGVHRPGPQARAGGRRPHRRGDRGQRARVEGRRLGPRPVASGTSRAWRELTTATGRPAAASAATTPPVAPRGRQDHQRGGTAGSRATRAAIPTSALATPTVRR